MKNLHDIIQKNSEMFDEAFPPEILLFELPSSVTDVRGTVRKMNRDIMFFNGKYVPKEHIKSFILSSQLSIIQAIDEWAEKTKKQGHENVSGNTNVGIYNSALSDLRYFLNEAKTKLQ